MLLYVGFGANTGRRRENIEKAIGALDGRIGALVGCSAFYETEPVGFVSDHLFLNAVAAFDTHLSPEALLAETQQVERDLGRTSKSTAGIYHDRPIDIDLLLLGDVVLSRPGLTLPHPALSLRRFVLEPLAELAPGLRHPVLGQTVARLLDALNRPRIGRPDDAEPRLLDALNRLLPQLSGTAAPLTAERLQALLHNPSTLLYVVRDETDTVRGMATLCLCASPTGTKAWIEDVVVEAACRGRGYGRALVRHLMSEAARLGAKAALLTSRPSRKAANALYASVGFERRDTNVYRWTTDRRPTAETPSREPADGKNA